MLTELGLGPSSVLLFIVVLGGVGWWLYHWFWQVEEAARSAPLARLGDVEVIGSLRQDLCGPPTPDGQPVAFEMLYSEEKQAWIEQAADDFARLCPNIQVKLTAMGGVQSADAILSGAQRPLIWAPTDDLIVSYLQERWREQSSEPLLDPDDRTPLAWSPLVALLWYDRLQMLKVLLTHPQADAEGPWMTAICPVIPREPDRSRLLLDQQVPGRWVDWYDQNSAHLFSLPDWSETSRSLPSREELARWGRVKIGHTSPTQSTSGFELLYLLAYDFSLPPAQRTRPRPAPNGGEPLTAGGGETTVLGTEPLRGAFAQGLATQRARLRSWLQRCQAGLGKSPRSAEMLTGRMLDLGPRELDGVVTFEHLALDALQRLDRYPGHKADVRVLYPQPTFLNQHPAFLLWLQEHSSEREAQRAAARRWLTYLRGKEQQQKAILHGFRPASALLLLDYDVEGNPFLGLRRYGVLPTLQIQEPPRLEGSLLPALVDTWKAAVGRN